MKRQMIRAGVETRLLAVPDTWVWHNAGESSWVQVSEDGILMFGHVADWRVCRRPAGGVHLPRHATLVLEFTAPELMPMPEPHPSG